MRRTQIYLGEEQHRDLTKRARSKGVTASTLVREAVDEYLAKPHDEAGRLRRFKNVAASVAGSAPELPSGKDYVRELRAAGARRATALDERRRRERR